MNLAERKHTEKFVFPSIDTFFARISYFETVFLVQLTYFYCTWANNVQINFVFYSSPTPPESPITTGVSLYKNLHH